MSVLVLAAFMVVQGMEVRPTVPVQPSQRSAPRAADEDVSILDVDVESGDEPGEDEGGDGESAEAEPEVVEAPEEIMDEPMTIEVARPRASARTEETLAKPINAPPCAEAVPGLGDGALRPALLEPRSELGAALLGGLVGFGTGDFYAGNPKHGIVLAITDTLFLGGLAGSIWALNDHAVNQDRRTGLSLARGERDRDGTESTLTGLAIGLGIAAGLSRAFQVYDGYHSAAQTNAVLRSTSFVPLASLAPLRNGGAVSLGFSW